VRYRLRDLLLPPGLLSLARIPLAVCFPLLIDRPPAAVGVLLLAGFTDVLDGWIARRYRLVTATGTALDPITDKLFVLTVAITLVVSGRLPVGAVVLLSTREIGELPLLAWFALSPRARASRGPQPSANVPGKIATFLQFGAVAWALARAPGLVVPLAITAVGGAFAALSYWHRALRTFGSRVSEPRLTLLAARRARGALSFIEPWG
jgi:cardiolipin synthase (CMP-forming)